MKLWVDSYFHHQEHRTVDFDAVNFWIYKININFGEQFILSKCEISANIQINNSITVLVYIRETKGEYLTQSRTDSLTEKMVLTAQ